MAANQMSQDGLFNVTAEELERFPSHLSCDVVIVGYGPVGMVLSALLAQRGLAWLWLRGSPNDILLAAPVISMANRSVPFSVLALRKTWNC